MVFYLQAFIRNALEAEARDVNENKKAPYVEVLPDDLEHFLPALPKAGPRTKNSYRSLTEFAEKDPTHYLVYRYGLVMEGYMTVSSIAPEMSEDGKPVHRKSMRPSGEVYPQDMNWGSAWASVDPSTLDADLLPDPVANAKAKLASAARTAAGTTSTSVGSSTCDPNVLPDPVAAAEAKVAAARKNLAIAEAELHRAREMQAAQAGPKGGPAPTSTDRPATEVELDLDAMDVDPAHPSNTAPQLRPETTAPATPPAALKPPQGLSHVPRPVKRVNAAKPTEDSNQAMDVDRPRPSVPLAIPTTLGPNISPLTPLPDERMQTDAPLADPHISPSRSQAVPAPQPLHDSPTPPQLPSGVKIPLDVDVYQTETLAISTPTESEITDFKEVVKGCDADSLTAMVYAVVSHLQKDPEVGLNKQGTKPKNFKEFKRKFWAILREMRGSAVSDGVFPYLRDDHAVVDSGVGWVDFLEDMMGAGCGHVLLEGAEERFAQRAKPHFAPVFDIDRQGDHLTELPDTCLESGSAGSPDHAHTSLPGNQFKHLWARVVNPNRHGTDQPANKNKRMRSDSMNDARRNDGVKSPPKSRVRQHEDDSEEDSDNAPLAPPRNAPPRRAASSSKAAGGLRGRAVPGPATRASKKRLDNAGLEHVDEESAPGESSLQPADRRRTGQGGHRVKGTVMNGPA